MGHRYGASFNAGAGLELLTARGWDDYVDIAAALVDRSAEVLPKKLTRIFYTSRTEVLKNC